MFATKSDMGKNILRVIYFFQFLIAILITYQFFILHYNRSLWVDEVTTLGRSFSCPTDIIKSLYYQAPEGYGGDLHPPLYFIIANLLYHIGGTEFLFRSLNFSLIAIMFFYSTLIFNKINRRYAGVVFSLFFATSISSLDPLLLIRPYAIYCFFQVASIVSLIAWLQKKNYKFIIATVVFNIFSIYTNYASIGNVAGECLYILLMFIFNKAERRFYLNTLLWLCIGCLFYIPWIQAYIRVINIAHNNYSPAFPHSFQGYVNYALYFWEILLKNLFLNNYIVLCIFACLLALSLLQINKKTLLLLFLWGWMPFFLIFSSTHPIYSRYILTLYSSIFIAIGLLCDILVKKTRERTTFSNITSLLIVTCPILMFIFFMYTGAKKQQIDMLVEPSPYKQIAQNIALNCDGNLNIVSFDNDKYTNTILQWYLGDKKHDIFSTDTANKDIYILKRDGNNSTLNNYKKIYQFPGYAGNAGFNLFQTYFPQNNANPRIMLNEHNKTIDINFNDITDIRNFIFWKNLTVNLASKTLEPAFRLNESEAIMKLVSHEFAPHNYNISIDCIFKHIKNKSGELIILSSNDNIDYKAIKQFDFSKNLLLNKTIKINTIASSNDNDLYIKILLKPGFTNNNLSIKSIKIEQNYVKNILVPAHEHGLYLKKQPYPVSASVSYNTFRATTKNYYSAGYLTNILSPLFDANDKQTNSFFLDDNVRIKTKEFCATCKNNSGCYFIFYIKSPRSIQELSLFAHPSIFNDKQKNNYATISFSLDGKNYKKIYALLSTGNDAWHGEHITLHKKFLFQDTRNIFLRFDMSSEGAQFFSGGNNRMYITTISSASSAIPLHLHITKQENRLFTRLFDLL